MGAFTIVEVDGGEIQIQDSGGTVIDPATNAVAAAIQAAVEAIRDTAGIKKITDALPVGDNALGRVKIIGDAGTNVAKVSPTGALSVSLSSAPGTPKVDKVKNAGSSDMVVNGSGTAVDFEYGADPTDDIFVEAIRVVLVSNTLKYDGNSFGSIAALTNGVRIAITTGGVETVLGVLKTSEDLSLLSSRLLIETGLSANDVVVVGLSLPGTPRLVAGSGDKIQFKIQDNMAPAGPNSLVAFQAEVFGVIL